MTASVSFWHNFVVANDRDFQFEILYVLNVIFYKECEYCISISMRSSVFTRAQFLFSKIIKYLENIGNECLRALSRSLAWSQPILI